LPTRQPSLLARRQANADRKGNPLKALDLPPAPKRRATTPEQSPSYRLLVFPPESSSSPRQNKHPLIPTLHRPRPLRRSNTAPGALSPGLKNKQLEEELSKRLPPMSEREELLEEDNRQALTPTPSEPSTPTTPTDNQSMHSYNTFNNDRSSSAWDPSLTEPSWEMITIGKVAEPGDRFSDAKFATGEVQVQGLDEPEGWHRSDEGVMQVARSMSVTKARRHIVGPKRLEVVNKNGERERFVERKPLTPTLVQMVQVPGNNRKSVRVMIEDA